MSRRTKSAIISFIANFRLERLNTIKIYMYFLKKYNLRYSLSFFNFESVRRMIEKKNFQCSSIIWVNNSFFHCYLISKKLTRTWEYLSKHIVRNSKFQICRNRSVWPCFEFFIFGRIQIKACRTKSRLCWNVRIIRGGIILNFEHVYKNKLNYVKIKFIFSVPYNIIHWIFFSVIHNPIINFTIIWNYKTRVSNRRSYRGRNIFKMFSCFWV